MQGKQVAQNATYYYVVNQAIKYVAQPLSLSRFFLAKVMKEVNNRKQQGIFLLFG